MGDIGYLGATAFLACAALACTQPTLATVDARGSTVGLDDGVAPFSENVGRLAYYVQGEPGRGTRCYVGPGDSVIVVGARRGFGLVLDVDRPGFGLGMVCVDVTRSFLDPR